MKQRISPAVAVALVVAAVAICAGAYLMFGEGSQPPIPPGSGRPVDSTTDSGPKGLRNKGTQPAKGAKAPTSAPAEKGS